MKRNIIIVLCILFSFLVGFNYDSEQMLVQSGKEIVEKVSEKNIEFVEVVDSTDLFYPGYYLYTDGEYNYYVNIESQFLTFISPIEGKQNNTKSRKTIDLTAGETIAKYYFETAVGDLLIGDLSVDSKKLQGIGYLYTISEKIDDIETGTKGSIILDSDGSILSVALIKGDPEKILNLDKKSIISKATAAEIALEALKDVEILEILNSNPSDTELKTFKGTIYWTIRFPVALSADENRVYNINYYVKVDALTGEIIEVYHDLY